MMFKIDLKDKDAKYIESWLLAAYDGCELHGFRGNSGFIYRYNSNINIWENLGIIESVESRKLALSIAGRDDLALYIPDPSTPEKFLSNVMDSTPFIIFQLNEDSYHFILKLNEIALSIIQRPVYAVFMEGNAIGVPVLL